MPHPPWTLDRALEGICGSLPFEVRGDGALPAARQTGFVWTRQPGVVCLAMTRDYLQQALANPDVVAVLVPPAVADRCASSDRPLLVSERADELFHYLHCSQPGESMADDPPEIDASARVDPSALLSGRVRIGAGARIGPGAVISGPVDVGRDVVVDARAVVGCQGLYMKTVLGQRRQMPHFGGVALGAGARIMAGAVVARSAIRGEATRIGDGACIGILSNVGHDATVGEGATVSSHVVIAGRATIGANAWIGASASVSNAVSVGARAEVRIGAVVIQDVPADGDVSGNFARPHAANLRRFLEEARK
jgi:UDP-3-O-[3-hydroxymyristoyl] glucosamine N-acyltransferase